MVGVAPLRFLLIPPVLLLLLLGGCGHSSFEPRTVGSLRLQASANGVPDLIVPYELTPEMEQWLAERIDGGVPFDRRLAMLLDALFSDGRSIEYDNSRTGTAREVCAPGRANCLAFTHLFVGMARKLGVPVYFLQVRDVEEHERDGDLVVISDHIAVGYGPSHDMTVIDFASIAGTRYRRIHPISDESSVAMYYSNRGAEGLRNGDLKLARRWLEDAVRVDPLLAAAWVNLGVVLRRSGSADGAEQAYRRALELDREALSAYHNLAALLALRGREQEGAELLELTARSGSRNPFTYLALGDLSLRHGRYDEAERFYRRALRLDDEEAEAYAALGLLQVEAGAIEGALRSLKRAPRLDPDQERVALLERRLSTAKLPQP